jgi:hypothetical protein
MLRKTLLTEVFWLIGVLILSIIVQWVLSQLVAGNGALDINLHDTYFEVEPTTHYFSGFVFVAFIVYLIRVIFASYKTPIANVLLMLFNLLLIFCLIPLAFQALTFIKPNFNGWTVYPPLSALPKAEPPMFNYLLVVFRVFLITEIALVVHLCFVSVKVGTGVKKNS